MTKQPKRTAQPQPPSGALTPVGPSSTTAPPMARRAGCASLRKAGKLTQLSGLGHGRALPPGLPDSPASGPHLPGAQGRSVWADRQLQPFLPPPLRPGLLPPSWL